MKINDIIQRHMDSMEENALNYAFSTPVIIQIKEGIDGEGFKTEESSIDFFDNEPFPQKMELVTAILSWFEEKSTASGEHVVCSLYGEHLIAEGDEVLYVQVKEGLGISHRAIRIQREALSVGADGKLNSNTELIRFF